LQQKNTDYQTGAITFEHYDEGVSMLLDLLIPILKNNENVSILSKISAYDMLTTVCLIQRLPQDFPGGRDGTEVNDDG
jgi:hypothetical protein